MHHTLGPGVGFYGDGDEHLGTVHADFLQTLTDCLTLLEGYITGNERHAVQHVQSRMAHNWSSIIMPTNWSCSTGRTYGLGAVAATSEKLHNTSRRTGTSPICQRVAAYPAVQRYQPQDHK